MPRCEGGRADLDLLKGKGLAYNKKIGESFSTVAYFRG
jgi:hypothetical protein